MPASPGAPAAAPGAPRSPDPLPWLLPPHRAWHPAPPLHAPSTVAPPAGRAHLPMRPPPRPPRRDPRPPQRQTNGRYAAPDGPLRAAWGTNGGGNDPAEKTAAVLGRRKVAGGPGGTAWP